MILFGSGLGSFVQVICFISKDGSLVTFWINERWPCWKLLVLSVFTCIHIMHIYILRMHTLIHTCCISIIKLKRMKSKKMKMFPSFWITEFMKELVIIVSNESTLINPSFIMEPFEKRPWYLKGHNFENRINHMIMLPRQLARKFLILKFFSRILRKLSNKKWWVFVGPDIW